MNEFFNYFESVSLIYVYFHKTFAELIIPFKRCFAFFFEIFPSPKFFPVEWVLPLMGTKIFQRGVLLKNYFLLKRL